MQKFSLFVLLHLLAFADRATAETHEFVLFRFQTEISAGEQKKLMEKLTPLVSKKKGFKRREFFYSSTDNRWIDHVVWAEKALAEKAAEEISKDPAAGAVFQKIDPQSIILSHYQKEN